MTTIIVGELVRLRTSEAFTALDGTATDPTTVTVTVRSPSGATTAYTDAVNDPAGTGLFYKDITPLEAGVWSYQFAGSGNVSIIEQAMFTVVAALPTAVDSGLVTVATYRRITLDTTSADSAIMGALAEAQTLVEEYLQRKLTSAQRTETLILDRSGRVHPSAVPITAVASPAGATIDGFAISSVDPDESPSLLFWSEPPSWGSWRPRATVTYTGGFTAATLPATIARHLALEAWAILHPADLSAVASGATSVSVGDASVTFGPGGASGELSPVTKATLRRYRRNR